MVSTSKALMHNSWHFQNCATLQIDSDTLSLQLKERLQHTSHAEGFIRQYKARLIYNTMPGKKKRCLFYKWEKHKQITDSQIFWPHSSEITFNYTVWLKEPVWKPLNNQTLGLHIQSCMGRNSANKWYTVVSVTFEICQSLLLKCEFPYDCQVASSNKCVSGCCNKLRFKYKHTKTLKGFILECFKMC